MSFTKVFARLIHRPAAPRRRKAPRSTGLLWLEPLEGRLCPSWTTPVNLGPPINTTSDEGYPVSLTNNGLSLYFGSNRPGSYGQQDIWVSQRATINDPWGPPQNLGPTINSPAPYLQHSAHITEDGHRMFFYSTRPGDYGDGDLWVSYRQDTHDDFAWGEPVNLGPNVNSVGAVSACPSLFEDPRTGLATLYFVSDRLEDHHLHVFTSSQLPDGSFGPAVPVPELNSPRTEEHFAVRPDGLMGIVDSNRLDGFGRFDLWITTRASLNEPWSTPVNMGPDINTDMNDAMPSWSPDGRTLFFGSDRSGGYGGTDLYYTTWQPDTWTVTNTADSGPGSLRQTIAAAFSGDRIVFDPSMQGHTITLTTGELAINKDLDIEGLGADQLAISGNHQSRVFDIGGGATVTIAGLTITDGLAFQMGAVGLGGAIRNVGSTLTVANDVFSNNEARGVGAQGRGGAIECDSGATLNVTDSRFLDNLAHGIASGSTTAGAGGAIYTMSGSRLTVTRCLFSHNQAIGDNQAVAGAIDGTVSTTVTDSIFIGNQCIGGSNGQSGFSRGGAIYNSAGTLTVVNSTFTGNQAIGGSNNTGDDPNSGGGFAGAIANTDRAILFVRGSHFSGNQALGGSNNVSTSTGNLVSPGSSYGGGLLTVGVATVTDSTFEDNEARGGSGNRGAAPAFRTWVLPRAAQSPSGQPIPRVPPLV
jgi:hypothetical protein